MKFLLYLPFAGKSGPARMGKYTRSHEHGGKLLFKGVPLEVDPFDPVSVREFNATVKQELELSHELGIRIYPLPPRLEMIPVEEPTMPEPVVEAPVAAPRKPGRRTKIAFPELEPAA